MGLRQYDPVSGRWLTRDPIGYSGGLNLYAYCDGDPVNFADPMGTETGYKPVDNVIRGIRNGWQNLQDAVGNAFNHSLDAKTYGGSYCPAFGTGSPPDQFFAWGNKEILPPALAMGSAAMMFAPGFGEVGAPVVIGENMGRVAAAADSLGAETYSAMKIPGATPDFWNSLFGTGLSKGHNWAWIQTMKAQGRTIYDIGIDVDRTTGRSIYYQMEQRATQNYDNLVPWYWPGSKSGN